MITRVHRDKPGRLHLDSRKSPDWLVARQDGRKITIDGMGDITMKPKHAIKLGRRLIEMATMAARA